MNRWREILTEDAAEARLPLDPADEAVRVRTRLTDDGWRAVAALLAGRPKVALWFDDHGEDLEPLRWFTDVRRLHATSLRLASLEAVASHPALERLILGDTLKPVSLRPIAALTNLQDLSIRGTWKHPETISGLTRLEALGIGGVDIELLLPLTGLRQLLTGLGTLRTFSRLPEVGRLELIDLYRIRGLADVDVLADIPTLRHLSLQSMSAITRLPSFAGSPALRRVDLEAMKGITDLSGLAEAPALRYLLLVEMPQLDPQALQPFVGHPSLVAGIWGLGSERKNIAAQDLLPLPPEPYRYDVLRPDRARDVSRTPEERHPWYTDDLSD